MPARELIAILEAHGFSEVRRRGSHIALQRVDQVCGTITSSSPSTKKSVSAHSNRLSARADCRGRCLRVNRPMRFDAGGGSQGASAFRFFPRLGIIQAAPAARGRPTGAGD
ncbi:MAG: type II toxin-antitoxin system HicA family toxin [Thermoguttaceae bacterium]